MEQGICNRCGKLSEDLDEEGLCGDCHILSENEAKEQRYIQMKSRKYD